MHRRENRGPRRGNGTTSHSPERRQPGEPGLRNSRRKKGGDTIRLGLGLNKCVPSPARNVPQVLFTLIQSQALNGVGEGRTHSLPSQSLMQPAVASSSWIHTPGCMVPRPLPGLGSWGGPGPGQVPGRTIPQLLRWGGGVGRSVGGRREASPGAPGLLQEAIQTQAATP